MSADIFIPIAEDTGAIIEIGREVLRQACHAVQLWRRTVSGHSDLGVSVNVSVHQVFSGRRMEHVAEALEDSGMPVGFQNSDRSLTSGNRRMGMISTCRCGCCT